MAFDAAALTRHVFLLLFLTHSTLYTLALHNNHGATFAYAHGGISANAQTSQSANSAFTGLEKSQAGASQPGLLEETLGYTGLFVLVTQVWTLRAFAVLGALGPVAQKCVCGVEGGKVTWTVC